MLELAPYLIIGALVASNAATFLLFKRTEDRGKAWRVEALSYRRFSQNWENLYNESIGLLEEARADVAALMSKDEMHEEIEDTLAVAQGALTRTPKLVNSWPR